MTRTTESEMAGPGDAARGRSAGRWRLAGSLVLIILVWAVLFPAWLGSTGLADTEGHRAIPGWGMLASGDAWRQEMFGLTYLRKPPGMPWAVALSGWVLGASELSARLVSALSVLGCALVAWCFTRRWFGDGAGIAGGLSIVLLPLLWAPGRAAEIEPLLVLGVGLGAMGLLAMCAGPGSVRRGERLAGRSILLGLVVVVGAFVALVAKGPAGAPVLLSVPLGCAIASRSWRPLACWGAWVALALGLGGAAIAAAPVFVGAPADAVHENLSQFVFGPGKLLKIATLPVAAFASMLPASLALVAVWGLRPGAGGRDGAERDPAMPALGAAWAWVLSVGTLTLIGIDNARYAMPACVLLAPVVAGVLASCAPGARLEAGRALARLDLRPVHGVIVAGGLTLAGFVGARLQDAHRARSSGREAGLTLGAMLPDGSTLWADGLIEARPETLLYGAGPTPAAFVRAPRLDVRWAREAMWRAELPPPGGAIVLRTDAGSDEWARYGSAIEAGALVELGRGAVHEYTFVVLVRPRP